MAIFDVDIDAVQAYCEAHLDDWFENHPSRLVVLEQMLEQKYGGQARVADGLISAAGRAAPAPSWVVSWHGLLRQLPTGEPINGALALGTLRKTRKALGV